MAAEHKRYRRRAGTIDAVTLPGDSGMPASTAPGSEWAAYHQARAGVGGFDPIAAMREKQ